MNIAVKDVANVLKMLSPLPLPQPLRPAIIDYEAHPYISPVFNEITQEESDQALRSFEQQLPDQTTSSRPLSERIIGVFGRFLWPKANRPGILSDLESTLCRETFVPTGDKLDAENRALFDHLWKDGAISFRIPPAQKSKLAQALTPMITATDEKLTAKGDRRGDKRMVHADIRTDCQTSEQPEVMDIVNDIMTDSGILQIAAVYSGKPVTVKHLSLMINQASSMESIFATYYEDAWGIRPQKVPKAVYYHVDSMFGCSLKMMLYINDVDMDNGPFQYVMGSARAADPLDLLIRKYTDTLGLSHRQIMALPKELRRKSHFGFDLLDEMPETDAYLQHENSFCSSTGDLVLFDANGIHRGGMAKKERRVALQILLE